MLVVVLDHTIRDLVFYSVGIIINMSLHEQARPALLKLPVVDKLIDVLKDANLEDMDLARVAAKAINNLQGVQNTNQFWSEEAVTRLDEFTRTFGEELDEIMDVATDDELEQIQGLRDQINQLVNDMPEVTKECTFGTCGRKFKSLEELQKHMDRRHGVAAPK